MMKSISIFSILSGQQLNFELSFSLAHCAHCPSFGMKICPFAQFAMNLADLIASAGREMIKRKLARYLWEE